jgi:hypothetical protein
MKAKKLKYGDILEIIWHDSNIPATPGWMSEEQHQEWVRGCGSIVRSVGVYISEDEHFINIVGDIDHDEDTEKSVLRPINIGKGFVKDIFKLRRGK